MGTGQLHGKVVKFLKKKKEEKNETWKENELWKKNKKWGFLRRDGKWSWDAILKEKKRKWRDNRKFDKNLWRFWKDEERLEEKKTENKERRKKTDWEKSFNWERIVHCHWRPTRTIFSISPSMFQTNKTTLASPFSTPLGKITTTSRG